ncbi:UNVERIFIED_CONTAM: hypothetical protein FKN15_034736 [Acipenser sinensis]
MSALPSRHLQHYPSHETSGQIRSLPAAADRERSPDTAFLPLLTEANEGHQNLYGRKINNSLCNLDEDSQLSSPGALSQLCPAPRSSASLGLEGLGA